MIPANFEYHRPKTQPEALALLGQYGEDARVLADSSTGVVFCRSAHAFSSAPCGTQMISATFCWPVP